MNQEMPERSEPGNRSRDKAGLSRRAILGGAAASFLLTASGLYLPDAAEEAAAREGALGGAKGGRHGQDRKGQHRRRTHGDKKDKKDKGQHGNEAPPQSHGPFRASALTVVNLDAPPLPPMTLNCTFYYQIKTGLDDYGPPVASVERTLAPGESFRYAPDRFRVGVLIKRFMHAEDVYADVRNIAFWLPTGSLRGGQNLDPAAGNTGSIRLREQGFDQGEQHGLVLPRLSLGRKRDSDTHIEWQLTVTQI